MIAISSHPKKCLKYHPIIQSFVLLVITTNVISGHPEPSGSSQYGGPLQSQSMGGSGPQPPDPRFSNQFGERSSQPYQQSQQIDSMPDPGIPVMPDIDMRLSRDPRKSRADRIKLPINMSPKKTKDPRFNQMSQGQFNDFSGQPPINKMQVSPIPDTSSQRLIRPQLQQNEGISPRLSVEPPVISNDDNQSQKRRCRKFEGNSIKNIEMNGFSQISGDWNLLYASSPTVNQKCSQISLKPLNERELEFKQLNNCENTLSGVLSRVVSTSKLLLTIGERSSSFWTLESGIPDILLVYQCFKLENVVNSMPMENYKLYSRSKQISQTVLQTVSTLLMRITNGVSLTPTPHIDCNCNRQIGPESGSPQQIIPSLPPQQPLSSPLKPNPNTPLGSDANIMQNPGQKKRCRKFEFNSIKNLELSMLSGEWDEVYASNSLNKKCSHLSLKEINDKELDFNQYNDCDITSNGTIMKIPFSSKMVMTMIAKTSSFWTIDLGVMDQLLIYQCVRSDNDPNAFVFENYRVLVRQKPLSETDLQKIQNILSQITNGVSLSPIPHKQCTCDPNKAPIPTIITKEPEVPAITQVPIDTGISAGQRCRKFDELSMKSFHLGMMTGNWNQLYTSYKTDKICTRISMKPINENEEEYREFDDCDNTMTGTLSKVPLSDKLNLTINNIHSSFWNIDVGSQDHLLVYQCVKQDNDEPVFEIFRVFSRRKQLPENDFQIITELMAHISKSVKLSPIPHKNCLCDPTKPAIKGVDPNAIQIPKETIVSPLPIGGDKGNPFQGCPEIDFVRLQFTDWERLSDVWYAQWFSKDNHNGLSIEIGRIDPRTPTKRWIIIREGTDIKTGVMELDVTNGQIVNRICGQKDMIFYLMSTDFEQYIITYSCNPITHDFMVGSWTRIKELNASQSDDIALQTSEIMAKNGLKGDLYAVEQANLTTPTSMINDSLVCKDIRDKTMLDIDIVQLRGNWRTILLNVDDNRCIGIKENKSALSDPNNRDEFWFDVYTERGNQGLGRIKSYDDRRLTQFNTGVPGERNFSILDTDYVNYFVYYECNIIDFGGVPNKIVEFGLMTRKANAEPEIINHAIQLFNENGLGTVHPVDQKDCHFKKDPIIPKENFCNSLENSINYDFKNTDLDMMLGKWWAHYLTNADRSDTWIEIERNSNFTSDYTHVIKIVVDDSVFTLSMRKCLFTGNIMMKDEYSSSEELQWIFQTDDYNSHLFAYKCHELPGLFSVISKFGVFSRNCDLSDNIRARGKLIAQELGISEKFYHVKQYQCLLEYKYETRLLSEKCIQFHDSQIVEPDLSQMIGQWDRHLMSERLPHSYDYAIVTYKAGSNDYIVFPHQYHSRKKQVNGTNLMRTISITSKYVVLGNEAFIGLDYNSFILKYSCAQYELKGAFVVKELLILSLRPHMSARLVKEPDLFAKIINSIPEKSLSKVSHLISQLTHQLNPKYRNFGQTVMDSVNDRLNKWRTAHQLSSKPDREVYKFLVKGCTHFDNNEQVQFDIHTIATTNWTLDYANYIDGRLTYDRLLIKKQSHDSYELSLFNGNKLVALSDSYYDKEDGVFWTYTEGRRARKTYLFSNIDYRIVYSCSERYVDGILRAQEILYFYSSENTRRPRDWFSYLEALASHIRPKTLGKVTNVLESLIPVFNGCDKTMSQPIQPPHNLKWNFRNYVKPKSQFEVIIRGKPKRGLKSDEELSSTLNKICEFFEDDEMVDPDLKRLSGEWMLDWSNWINPIEEKGQFPLEINPNGKDYLANFYFKPLDGEPKLIKKMYHKRDKESRYFLKIDENPVHPRAQVAILWTNYDNYLITHKCYENELNGETSMIEMINFYSRKGSTDLRDISHYMEIIASNFSQKTTSKLYHGLNSMKPVDYTIIGPHLQIVFDNIVRNQTMPEGILKERMSFAEDIFFTFIPKGLAVEKLNKQVVGKEYSDKNADEVLKTLSSVCRQFDDSELVQVQSNSSALFLGNWRYDYYTRTKFVDEYDNFEVDLKGNLYDIRFFLGSDLVVSQQSSPIPGSRWVRSSLFNDRNGIMATLYLDEQIIVQYWCHENDIDGVLADSEGLIFASRGPLATTLDVYLNKLQATVSQPALSKIVELISNLRPLDNGIRYRECPNNKPKNYKFSEKSVVNQILHKNCIYFNQRDLVEPNFRRLFAFWKVRLANQPDFHKPYDTVQWYDGVDRFFSKLRLGTKFQCKTPLAQIEDTNYYEENFDYKRAIQAILYTDYTDLMVIYSCKENIHDPNLPVIENLKLLIRNDSTKLSMDLQEFQRLVSTKLKTNTFSKIERFIPTLKYLYNENMAGTGAPDSGLMSGQSQVPNIFIDQARFSPKQITKGNSIQSSLLPELRQKAKSPIPQPPMPGLSPNPDYQRVDDEECPDLDGIAQQDIDFSRLVGRWDAIYTSNSRWDKDCIFTDDVYDRKTDSIIQMKSTSGKRHKVMIRHSGSNGRQHILVDNTVFQSWILATDYDTYRLSYTCYVKEVKGQKKKIELERLYVRNVETTEVDPRILEILRQKSALIGKALEPIDRSHCQTGPVPRAPGA